MLQPRLTELGITHADLSFALDRTLTDVQNYVFAYMDGNFADIPEDVKATFDFIMKGAQDRDAAILYARTMHSATGRDDREEGEINMVPPVRDYDQGVTYYRTPDGSNVRLICPIPKGWMVVNMHGSIESLREESPFLRWSVKFCLRTPAVDTIEHLMLANKWSTTERFLIDDIDTLRRIADCESAFFGNLDIYEFVAKAMFKGIAIPVLRQIMKHMGGEDGV